MAKKDETKKIMDEISTLNYQIEQLNDRIISLNTRVEHIANFTEYIAWNLDWTICYAEHIAEVYSSNISQLNPGLGNLTPQRRVPTYEEYKEIKGE